MQKVLIGFIVATAAFSSQAREYTIDPNHSTILFEVSHWGYGTVVGRFDEFTGTVHWDAADPGSASAVIDINPASVNTGVEKLDAHLQNEDFFEVETWPDASFRSTAYRGDADGGELDGILSLHGKEGPITLKVTKTGEGESAWGDQRIGFKGQATIDRGDWGMDWRRGKGADEVTITVWIEARHKP